jgi:hypothetical protein
VSLSDVVDRLGVNRTGLKPFSNIPSTPSMAMLPAFFKFRVFDLQICLWLTAASLYRGMDKFDDARVAIAEADRVLEALIKTEDAIGTAKSRIFLKGHDFSTAGMLNGQRPNQNGSLGNKTRSTWNVKPDENGVSASASTGRWGLVNCALRRQMADIAFEVCLSLILA